MKARVCQIKCAILIIAIGIASPANGIAEPLSTDRVFYFSAGWRTSNPSPQNRLQLGTVYQCDHDWCLEYEEFSGKDNLRRSPLPYKHEMVAPYGKHRCTDERLTTIHGVISSDVPARIRETEHGLLLQAGLYEYTWERDTSPAGGFVIAKISGGNVPFEQPVGFAYESDSHTGQQIVPDNFRAYFDGEIAHKNTLMGVMDNWSRKQSSIDFRRFKGSSISPVLSFTQPGHPDVVRRFDKPIWAQHTVLAPQDTSSRLNYIHHEYGHDFNANGCFDEFGHNKLMLPVFHGELIAALVYIEYTHDKDDGVPMISIGRYFRKR